MKISITCCYMLLLPAICIGQPPNPDVKELMVTSSPAYILLGVQPENIQRPSTPRDFIGGVQSAVVNGMLQPNFAMEINPFNRSKKQKDNQFYANDYFYNAKGAIKKNFAISIASSSSDTVTFGNLRQGLGLGYGARITILPGKVNDVTKKAFEEWEFAEVKSMYIQGLGGFIQLNPEIQSFSDKERQDIFNKVAEAVRKKTDLINDNKEILIAKLKVYADSYRNIEKAQLSARLLAERESIMSDKNVELTKINSKKIPFDRDGFILEFAVAGVTVFQDNEWGNMHHGKTAIWLTPSYRFSQSTETDEDPSKSVDLMGVLRFIWNEQAVDTANYFDFGLKGQFNTTKWNASIEGVWRRASIVPAAVKSNWTYSWTTCFNYTLNEMTTLKFSFGSGFDGNTVTYTDPNKMFVIGGINFAVFNGSKK